MLTEQMGQMRGLIDAMRSEVGGLPAGDTSGGPSPVGRGHMGPKKCRRYFTGQTLARLQAVQEREGRKRAWSGYRLKRERAETGCEVCGWLVAPGVWGALHVHHVIPVKAGGTDARENLMVLCPNHHAAVHRSGRLRGGQWTGPTTREAVFQYFGAAV